MRFVKNPLLLLFIGFLIGIVAAEAFYYAFDPIVLKDGSIEVVTDGDYYDAVAPLIAGARGSVHMSMFSMNYQTAPEYRESGVNKLVSQLVAARNRGVDVSVVLDDWPEGNERALRHLQRNNVPVSMFSGDGTLHAKLIVIDGQIVVLGSTNWSYHSLEKNNEANVIISDRRLASLLEDYIRSLST